MRTTMCSLWPGKLLASTWMGLCQEQAPTPAVTFPGDSRMSGRGKSVFEGPGKGEGTGPLALSQRLQRPQPRASSTRPVCIDLTWMQGEAALLPWL